MDERAPGTGELNCVLPRQVVLLGEALAPVAAAARLALLRKVQPTGPEFVPLEDLARHMGVIHHSLASLAPRIDALMTDIIRTDGVNALVIGRVAGRLEQVLSELVDGYLEAKASRNCPDGTEARALILHVYRHHIRGICMWMEELVDVIANPASAIQKRGIDAVDGIELKVTLRLTRPRAMNRLVNLANGLTCMPLDATASPPSLRSQDFRRPGLLGLVGALAFGGGIAHAVLG